MNSLYLSIILISLPLVSAQARQAQGIQNAVPSPSGNQVSNQNKVETRNAGDNTQLQINTQEKESFGTGSGMAAENRNQNAVENMSSVAQQVQQLLLIRTTGGIGEQVRQVAQEQNQAQTQIQQELNKLETQSNFTKKIFGPNYKAINNLNQQMAQNQLRIQKLEQLADQVQNQAEAAQLRETIQALIQQNTALQSQVQAELHVSSLLGWLLKLINQ